LGSCFSGITSSSLRLICKTAQNLHSISGQEITDLDSLPDCADSQTDLNLNWLFDDIQNPNEGNPGQIFGPIINPGQLAFTFSGVE
jgi:hypothetical protein